MIYETDKQKKAKPVSFEQAADEIWPQLKKPKPLPKEEAKPAPVKEPAKQVEAKPAPVKAEPQPEGRKIKKFFKRSDGTVAIIYKKEKAPKSLRAQKRQEERKAQEAEQGKKK